MVATIERLGARMLNRIVPKAIAQAGQCACDPNSCWCQNKSINNACCCAANCVTISCFCSSAICGN